MNKQLGLSASQFRICRRHFFLGYTLVRDTQQPAALPGRRATLARPHHDQLGIVSTAMIFVGRAEQFLWAAAAAWNHRSRILSGRDVLSRRLVSGPVPHPDAGLVPGRDSIVLADRRPDLRRAAPDGRNLGPCRMAVDVIGVSLPCIPLGLLTLRWLTDRSAGSDLAHARRAR